MRRVYLSAYSIRLPKNDSRKKHLFKRDVMILEILHHFGPFPIFNGSICPPSPHLPSQLQDPLKAFGAVPLRHLKRGKRNRWCFFSSWYLLGKNPREIERSCQNAWFTFVLRSEAPGIRFFPYHFLLCLNNDGHPHRSSDDAHIQEIALSSIEALVEEIEYIPPKNRQEITSNQTRKVEFKLS